MIVRSNRRRSVLLALAALGILWIMSGVIMKDTAPTGVPTASVPSTANMDRPAGRTVDSGSVSSDAASEPAQSGAATYRGTLPVAHFDVSPPLSSLKPAPYVPGKLRENEDRDNIPVAFDNVYHEDGALQSMLGPLLIPTPVISFDGPSNLCGGCAPPDPNGEIGSNHVVVMDNVHFQIFNRSGVSVFGPVANNTLWSGFGGPCQTENAGDPVVVYDQLADRWLLTQFTAAGPTYFNCLALSTSADPTGTYYRWAFSTGTNFPDYPKYGVWPDAYYISTREFAGGGPFAGVGAYAGDRSQMIAGNPNPTVISFLAPPGGAAYNVGDGLLPSDLDGITLPPANSPNYFVGSMDNGATYGAPQDALTLWKFIANFANPPSSSFTLANTLPIAPYDTIFPCSGRACIPQPGTTNRVDILSYRQRPMFRLAYRNFGTHESLVTNQSVEASTNMAGIRWWEIRSPNSGPVLFQDSTFAPGITDGIHRWMGSIAMDRQGNMALAYSASSSSLFPSIRYTGRLSTDPLNQMPQGEGSIIEGTGSQTSAQRWGDYTDTTVDPIDDCTFWHVNEYIPTTSASGWRLRIGAFKFNECTAGPTPTPCPTCTSTPTPTVTNTLPPSNTPTRTNTFTVTLTRTRTLTRTPTRTRTATPIGLTSTPTRTRTITGTPTITNTPTITLTRTITPTPTNSPTNTPTFTVTNTPTNTSTFTVTNTRTNTPTNTPLANADAYAHLVPAGPITVTLGSRVDLELFVNSGSNDVTAAQNYLTFTDSLIQNVNYGMAGCVLTSTFTLDNSSFEAALQNEVCNGPASCFFRGIPYDPGTISYASGTLSNCPDGCSGDFRVAQAAFCTTALGDALLHWQFSPPNPPARDSQIVEIGGDIVSNPALYDDMLIHIVPQSLIVGHVTWQGRPAQPNALQQLPITLTLKSGGVEANYPIQNTDVSGYFTVEVSALPYGSYDWRVKGPDGVVKTLPTDLPGFLANSGTTSLSGAASSQIEMGLMRAGDANNDNIVNISDFNILFGTFGFSSGDPGYDNRADFTGDGVISISDFNLLKQNFGIAGPPPSRAGDTER